MGNERKLRLIQVAKEFKVGLNTVTDFLQKKGIKSDGSPNTLVDAETYAVLEKEFGANRSAASARDSIRERISLKQTTVTLEEARKQEREEEKEVVIKSNVISVKDEIQQPKFLGKIDLSPKPKARRESGGGPESSGGRETGSRTRSGSPAEAGRDAETRSGRNAGPREGRSPRAGGPEEGNARPGSAAQSRRDSRTQTRSGPGSARGTSGSGPRPRGGAEARGPEGQHLPPRDGDPHRSAGARHDGRVGLRRRRQA